MKRGIEWLNARIGYQSIKGWMEMLFHSAPLRSHFLWLGILFALFAMEVVSGVILGVFYLPSESSAWSSVFYIQHGLLGGGIVRGLHHFCGQAMLWLSSLYILRLFFGFRQLLHNELLVWSAILGLGCVAFLQVTGRLLPWDQAGFWSAYTVVDYFQNIPLVGAFLKRFVFLSAEEAPHALGRSYALHIFLLPMTVFAFFLVHGFLTYRMVLKTPADLNPKRNLFGRIFVLIAGLTLFALLLSAGKREMVLTDPVQLSERPLSISAPSAFLWLQGTIPWFHPSHTQIWLWIFPILIIGILLAPFLVRTHWGNYALKSMILLICLLAIILTADRLRQEKQHSVFQSDWTGMQSQKKRVLALTKTETNWIHKGAISLLQNDFRTQGPHLFSHHCAGCHRYDGHDGLGKTPSEKPTASDLKGFASRAWVEGILDPAQISEDKYFGCTPFKNGKMAKYIKLKIPKLKDDEKEKLKKGIWALSAEAALPYQRDMDLVDAESITQGREYLKSPLGCATCHRLSDSSQGSSPDLVGYGSRQWLIDFISNPSLPRFYGDKNAGMPAFGDSKLLTQKQIEMLADWIREK